MPMDIENMSIMILDAGFNYSSQDVSKSVHKAFQQICGSENIYNFTTKSALDFSKKALETQHIYEDTPKPKYEDIVTLACDSILRYSILTQIDLILAIHGANISSTVIDCLKISLKNTKIAVWLVDEPQQIDFSRKYAEHYDYIFTNEKNTVKIHGEDKTFYLPTGFDEEIFQVDKEKLEDKYKCDVLISGSIYPNRFEFIEAIYPYIQDYDVKIVGKLVDPRIQFKKKGLRDAYNGEIVPISEIAKYMAGAKICLDIPRLTNVSEYGRTNKSGVQGTCVSPRIYEAGASGSLILTHEERIAIKELYNSDEYITYNSVENCANKIIYYLESEDERKETCQKAKKRTLENHTYTHRVKEIAKNLPDKSCNARLVGMNLTQESQNKIAKHQFTDIWQKNVKDNVEFIECGSIIEFSKEKIGENRTAILTSNGPSLEKNIDRLAEFWSYEEHENVDIISVNSAYRELRKRGIVPRFHVQIHPTEGQEKHFIDLPHDQTIFLASCLLANKVIHAWKGEKKLFLPMGVLNSDVKVPEEYKNKLSLVDSALVVGFSALVMLLHFRYERIAFLGFDFSYVNNRKYAFQQCNFKKELESNAFVIREDIHGSPIITSNVMLDAYQYVTGLTNGHKGVDFFNVTDAGILQGDRIRQMKLEEFI